MDNGDYGKIKKTLKDAINQHLRVKILYQGDDEARDINPYHFGICGGKDQLQAYQISGPSKSGVPSCWKNMELSKIEMIELTNIKFSPPDVDTNNHSYNPKDPKYSNIECQITYDGIDKKPKI